MVKLDSFPVECVLYVVLLVSYRVNGGEWKSRSVSCYLRCKNGEWLSLRTILLFMSFEFTTIQAAKN